MDTPDLETVWICLRSLPKSEHIAAARLRLLNGVEVYCPRLRYEKITRRGKVWFSEALFPGYVFVRLNLVEHQKVVMYTPGISGIVRFGVAPAFVPSEAIEELRHHVGDGEHVIESEEIRPGATITITTGLFKGLSALVSRVIPARQRVQILLEFLGDCREAEVAEGDVLVKRQHILVA